MNVFLRELKANRKSLIIWSVCMFLLVASGMAKYTAYSSDSQNSQIFSKMPYSVKALLGFGSLDVTTMSGYFAMLFLYVELVAAIHAVLLGAGIIAKEERDKTAEFLMVKPISRNKIITAKLSAAFGNVLILNIVSYVSSLLLVPVYNKGKDISFEISMFFLSMIIVQLIFLSLGAALAAFVNGRKYSGSIAMGILIAAFVISKITDMTDRLNFLNVFSPFKYFSYSELASGAGLNTAAVIFSLIIVAAFSASTYIFYKKRDLSI